MKQREFLLLASKLTNYHNIGNWLWSKKLDGMRCLWLPSTRGIPASELKFANIAKDARYLTPPVSTGLWSRYANVIHAPDYFLNELPPYPLDGELYIGPGMFQQVMETCKDIRPTMGWDRVKFMTLDCPTYEQVMTAGRVNNPNYKMFFGLDHINQIRGPVLTENPFFEIRHKILREKMSETQHLRIHCQEHLPFADHEARALLPDIFQEVLKEGDEGIVIRAPYSSWEPTRSKLMCKIKPEKDDEAVVIGYKFGTKRLEGMLGSLRVTWKGKVFDLSGMTDRERLIKETGEPESVTDHPISDIFPIGSKITFLYRELSDAGIPKDARYLRKHQ